MSLFPGDHVSFTNFLSTAAAVMVATALSANSLYAQTSFNAGFNSTPNFACNTGNGCTDFMIDGGGEFFQFVFTSAGDGGTMLWESQFGEFNSPSMNCRSAAYSLLRTEVITIKRSANEPFQFTSIYIDNAGGTNITISTFYRGSSVGTSQVATASSAAVYNFGGILVDEIRLSATDFYETNIDSFRGIIPAGGVPVIRNSFGYTPAPEQVTTQVDKDLVLTDADSSTLPRATVSITSGFISSQDVLSFTNNASTMGNITGSYDAAAAILTLTSAGATATVTQWQTALRSVTYTNGSDTPNNTLRSVTFVAYDETGDSLPATKGVSVYAVNDAPVLTVPAHINAPIGQPTAITGITVSDVDAGIANIVLSLSEASGTFVVASAPNISLSYWEATRTHYISGTAANINSYIAGSNVTYTSIAESPPTYMMTVGLGDNGNTGTGGTQTDSEEVTITKVSSSVDAWSLY